MTRITRILTGAASILVFMMAGSDAIADGIIGFGPLDPPSSIPTLSGYMLMVLGVLLAALAYRKLRAYTGGKPLASLVALGVMAAMSSISGNQIIKSAEAFVNPTVSLANLAGGIVHFLAPMAGDTPVTNATSVPLRITSITADAGETIAVPGTLPPCIAGSTVLQPGGSCYVNITTGT